MKKILSALALMGASLAALANPVSETSRLVITYKPQAAQNAGERVKVMSALSAAVRHTAAGAASTPALQVVRESQDGRTVVHLGRSMPVQEARDIARRLQEDPRVQAAEVDLWVKPTLTPTDPYYFAQWSLQTPTGTSPSLGGMNVSPLWARTTGSGVVMAVLDTGLLPHPEIASRIIPGYDFVSDATMGGDGDGRDGDPTDPGDFCTENGTVTAESSWHGTMVGGIMAAAADSQGIVGVAPDARLLNVRVLGRCGGWLSDVADGVKWAAGLSVSGAGAHTYGPLVMNLSLASSPGLACPSYMQSAIDAAVGAGSVVVVAAGNDGQNAVGTPANCTGVVSVAAHTGSADLAAYSNYLPTVSISGPAGGNCMKAASGCYTFPAAALGVNGKTTFSAFTGPVYMAGTSAAAPFVAATLALLRQLEPLLTPAEAAALITNTARPFPTGSFCKGNAQCGFGMLDAGAAVARLDTYYAPSVTAQASSASVKSGATVTLTAAATSKLSATQFTYTWTQTAGPAVTLTTAGATATFTAPKSNGTASFEVVASDASARTAKTTVSVAISGNTAPTVSAIANQTSLPGGTWTLTPAVSDVDGNYDRLVLLSGPTGMVASGKSLSWASPSEGTYDIRFVAVDTDGAESAASSFSLTVSSAPGNTGGNGGTGSSGGSSGDSGGGAWGLLGALLLVLAAGLKYRAQRQAA